MRISFIVFAFAACFALAGCSADDSNDTDTTNTNPSTIFVLPDANGEATGATAQLFDADGNEVGAISTTHIVGGTSCPQNLGKLVLENQAATGDMVATLALSTEGVAIDLTDTTATVSPGGSSEIGIDFNCMSTDTIDTQLVLNLEFGGRVGVFNIDLDLMVEGP